MLYDIFKNVAKKYSHNNALFFEDDFLTYEEVIKKVEQYSVLIEQEKSYNNSFLIYCTKSFHSILWQLACNKTQTIFINADINTPIDRLSHIINTTTPAWILTDNNEDLSSLGYIKNHIIDNAILWYCLPVFNKSLLLQDKYKDSITHIYFSSGSTGKPKGILLNDKPISNVVIQQAKQISLTPSSKFAWLLSPSFDASLSDIYSTLLSGSCLYICNFKMNQLKTLYSYFNSHGITHSDLSPSVLNLLNPKLFSTLKSVIFGGEVANENVIKSWVKSGINMFNAYGPTETTICSSLKQVDQYWTSNNIGKPLDGVIYYIENLDQNSSIYSELYISGNHLALGYDQDVLNTKKFITNNNILYYKTGDLVSLNIDGDYLFQGRIDRQFKYNGILISPEEIENYCLQAGCSEVLCKLEEKITLYYSGAINYDQLKKNLTSKLPSSMIPQKWIQMDNLKKNINGKIQL